MSPKSWLKRTAVLLLAFSLVLALAPAPAARAASTIRVSATGTTSWPIRVSATGTTSWPCGDTWASACALQTAFAHATNGDEVWVGKGVYKPTTSTTDRTATFQLKSYLVVYGGFALTETLRTQRDPATNIVVLSGDIDNNDGVDARGVVTTSANIHGANSYHVVTGVDGATLDGVTITGGNANAETAPNESGGGMINVDYSSPTLTNVTFSGNAARYYGGGMYSESISYPMLSNVTFSGNAAAYGGGMANWNSSNPALTNVTFSGNAATSGGGMYNYGSSPTLTNVTFSSNSATYGGGMCNVSSSPQVRNTLLWGDSGGEIYNNVSTPTISDGVVQGGCPSGSTCTRVISTNPLLAPLANYGGSMQTIPLLPGSSAIAATSTNCPATDQRGVTRSPTCDIGAFESQGFTLGALTGTPQIAIVNTGFAQPLGLSVTSAFGEPVAGGLIAFTAPASGASLVEVTPFAKTISVSGAVSAMVTANGLTGSYSVTASARGATSVNFALTNLGQILYAKPGGATSGLCQSWAASCELRYALNLALPGSNQELWVAAGIYTPTATTTDRTPTFQLVSGIAVYGGFGMTETLRTQRDPAANIVVLSGDIDNNDGVDARGVVTTAANITGANSYHVVTGMDGATLDGVTITGGNAQPDYPHDVGGGMYNYSSSPTLTNVTFSGNTAHFGGGMINVDSSNPTLTNVTFSGNSATTSGGGMFNDYNSSPTLTNVLFSGNVATNNNGGGMFNQNSSSPTLSSVTFSSNSAAYGGGLFNYQSSPTLSNVTFSGNSATQGGGGMINGNSSPTLTNVTFSGNTAYSGGGMFNDSGSNPQVRNTLLWGDSGGEMANAGGTPTITDSEVQGGCPADSTCTRVISANPLLSPLGSYGGSTPTIALLPGSSAINATSTNCPTTDQRGVARGSTCDIGAFESQGFTLLKSGGDGQSTLINTAFAQPLGLSVTSAFSEPVAGGVISFTAHPAVNGVSLAEVTPFTKTISASGAVSATVTANGLTGSYTVTASARGATSVNFALANKLATTTTLTSSPNPSTYGQTVTFTATVTSTLGIPSGTVNFFDNGASIVSGALNASGQATLTTASLIAGPHPITATYGGDANYNPSTSSVDLQMVNQAPATITLGNLNQTYDGTTKPVTSTTLPLGLMIVVTYTGISGTTYGPSTTAPTNAGTYQVDAAINDVNYQGTVTGTLIIQPANTTTSVTSSPNPSAYGQAVTFTATVTSSGGTPTGSITFTLDSTNLTVPLDANGQAVYVTQTLSLGNHPVSAAYSGDANYNVSSGVLSGGQTVNDVAVTGLTSINSSPTRLTDVTYFTATISTGSNVTYQWNFGDGQTASGALSSHTYAAAGNYTAIVTATNGAGSVSTVTPVTITNQRPVANAGAAQSVLVNAVVTLTGSGSTDPDGHLPLTYRWAQSGGPSVTFTPNVSVTSFTAPSAPTVLTFTLNVTDAQGLPNLTGDSVVITVGDVAIANLTAANDSPMKVGQLTHFTATLSAGSNVTYQWDFGEGHLASGATTSYTYPLTGTYTAIVTATNNLGSVSASTLVTIKPARLYLPLVLRY